MELYGSRGYPATTIEQICGEAGVTARHFYEEFATREALLVALYDALIARVLERVREAIYATGKASLDIVYDGVRAYFENVTEDPRRARILMLEVVGVSAALERHRRDSLAAFIAEMVQSTQRLEQAGLHPGIDTELLSAALVGAGQQLTIEWVLAEGKLPVRRLVDVLSAIWIRCLELDTKQVPPNG